MKRSILRECLYLILFSLYLIYRFLAVTMFYIYVPSELSKFFLLSAVALAAYTLLDNDGVRIGVSMIGYLAFPVMVLTGVYLGYRGIITIICFIISAYGIPMGKIVKVYASISLAIIVITVISAWTGIVEDITWTVNWNNLVRSAQRHGMGFIYPTDFVSCVFYCLSAWLYLGQKHAFRLYRLLIIIGIAVLTYCYCLTRLDSGCILILGLVYIYLCKNRGKMISKWAQMICLLSVPLCACISIWATCAYDASVPGWAHLNSVLSNRLYYGQLGIERYGFSMFGQDVVMRGLSVLSADNQAEYFYLDCSYINILLRYGFVCLVMVCCMFVYQGIRSVKANNQAALILVSVVAINSIVGQHLFDGFSNIFAFTVLANPEFVVSSSTISRIPELRTTLADTHRGTAV